MALTPKQIEYVQNANRRWNIKIGATRSGKTFVDYSTVIPKRIMSTTGDGLTVIMGYTQQTIERNVFEPMRGIWGNTLVGDILQSKNTIRLFGRTCHVIGADNVSAVSRLRGSGIEYCYGDEIPTWNQEVFALLKSRLDKPNSVCDGTGNPGPPNHWFKEFLDSDAHIYCQHYTIDDNPTLPPAFVANLKREYAGTVYYDRNILGLWRAAEGAIYPNFNEKKHVTADLPKMLRCWVGVDYGHSNPTAFVLMGLGADGRLYVIDEDIHKASAEGDQSPRGYSAAMIRFLRRNADDLPLEAVIVDPSARGFVNQLREDGVARVVAAINDVIPGIQLMSSIISADLLRVHPRCKGFIAEMQGYVWDEKAQLRGDDKPLKTQDHEMDAGRYVIMRERNYWKGRIANDTAVGSGAVAMEAASHQLGVVRGRPGAARG